jgi:glucoamylase
MVLAATEDKRHPGAFIASPSLPWAFGIDRKVATEFGSYALAWPRDLYQVASAMLAAGDRAGADRARLYAAGPATPRRAPAAEHPRGQHPVLAQRAARRDRRPDAARLLARTDKSTLDDLHRAAEFLVNYRKDGNTAQ